MTNNYYRNDFTIGTQVFYVPEHVPIINGFGDKNLDHPDVERGFIYGLTDNFPNARYVRYFNNLSTTGGDLVFRTRVNSQLTSIHQLVAKKYTAQKYIDSIIKQLDKDK